MSRLSRKGLNVGVLSSVSLETTGVEFAELFNGILSNGLKLLLDGVECDGVEKILARGSVDDEADGVAGACGCAADENRSRRLSPECWRDATDESKSIKSLRGVGGSSSGNTSKVSNATEIM